MVKCESVTNSYPKYVHFIHLLDSRNGSRIGKCFFLHGRWTIISCDLEQFSFKLLAVVQSDRCWMSCGIDSEFLAETKRYRVSVIGIFTESVGGEVGWRSEAVKAYSTGPKAQPWIILALIGSIGETLPSSFVWCCRRRPERLLAIQLWRQSSNVKLASLLTRLWCLALSKALEKSRAMMWTVVRLEKLGCVKEINECSWSGASRTKSQLILKQVTVVKMHDWLIDWAGFNVPLNTL